MNNGDVKPSLMPHQEKGVKFLRERTAAGLFDEQGLGKTKQLIEAVSQDIAAGGLDGALIICPNMIKSTWAEEVERIRTIATQSSAQGDRPGAKPFEACEPPSTSSITRQSRRSCRRYKR